MHFVFRQGRYCEFLEDDLKTSLPRGVFLKDEKSVIEIAERETVVGYFRPRVPVLILVKYPDDLITRQAVGVLCT